MKEKAKKQNLFTFSNLLLAVLIVYFIANTAFRLMGGG
jgi:hypothetical protein